jgi:aquaporin Z
VRKLVAEGSATFVLVFLGTGACVVDRASGGRLGVVGIGSAFGAAVYLGAFLFGSISGAHMNPAVTVALWRANRFSGREVGPYVLAQCIGALAASVLLLSMFGARAGDLGATHPTAGVFFSFFLEFAMTALLVGVVLRCPARWGAAAAATVVALEAIFGGPLTGASMNPARSLAPALASGRPGGLWIYMTAPVLGALIAARSVRRVP